MTQSRSLTRELALLLLGQISDRESNLLEQTSLEVLLSKALDTLTHHWRECLDNCAIELETAQTHLLDSDFQDKNDRSQSEVFDHLTACLSKAEVVLNGLSSSLEFPRLLILSNQEEIRLGAMKRVSLVLAKRDQIDLQLDEVMEGWRLKRLPRIDRDILRLAVVDLTEFKTPAAVTCNEAVELANRYSDDQGRRMINGVLRRLQNSFS